ncbi:MAG TPA: DUF6356 family protein [Steroidobacteraceae bacterium]|nr:DUF6356 family protein [Steroidobacteraceae bacterium]
MEKIFEATLIYLYSIRFYAVGGQVLNRLFLDHPRSVGESYLEHQRHAFGFGISLLGAALACLVHGVVPGLFVRTGSQAITRLHDRMVVHRTTRASDRVMPLQT